MKTVIGSATVNCLWALTITIATLTMAGRIAGPYSLVIPADGNPASVARAGCPTGTLGVFATEKLADGRLKVLYSCETS